MNKKAVSALMRLTFALVFLFIVIKTGANVVGPLLNPESKTLAYQSFDNLAWKLDSLMQKNNYHSSDSILLTLEKGYNIVAFEKTDTEIKGCLVSNTNIPRPDECGKIGETACLCLIKNPEKPQVLKCRQYTDNMIFYSQSDSWGYRNGCERNEGLEIKNYEGKIGKKRQIYIGGNPNSDKTFSENIYVETVDLQNSEKYAEVFDAESITFDMLRATGKKAHYVLITEKNAFNSDIRSKITSVCPEQSTGDCGKTGGHVPRNFDGAYEENGEFFYCMFDDKEQICKPKKTKQCRVNKKVEDSCMCQGLKITSGYCIQNNIYVEENEPEIISGCQDYNDYLNCVFDLEEINQNGCYMTKSSKQQYESTYNPIGDLSGGTQTGNAQATPFCMDCPTGVDKLKKCSDYEEKLSCTADACNVLLNSEQQYCRYDENTGICRMELTPNSDYCNYGELGCVLYFGESQFGVEYKCESLPEYKDYCQKITLTNTCDFYNVIGTPQGHEQWTTDPCDCDFDGQFPDTDGCTSP